MNSAIEVRDLNFATRSGPVVRIPELNVEERQIVVILGPSGCGKTTFLLLLCGLLAVNKGATVRLLGRSVTDVRKAGLVSISFQTPVLMPWRTAFKNVGLALELKGVSPDKTELSRALHRVHLDSDAQEYFPEALSSGMRSRVAVAQAMASRAKVLLMDEVFGTLDESTRTKMDLMLREINAAEMQATILFVTHSIDEALLLGDRVLIFRKLGAAATSNVLHDIEVKLSERTHRTRYTPEFLQQKQRLEGFFFEEGME